MRDDPDPGHSMIDAAVCDTPVASRHAVDILLPDDHRDGEAEHEVAERLRAAAEAALTTAIIGPCAVTLVLADDEEVRTLNRRFRGVDKPTNVLSFPAVEMPPQQEEPPYLGDVILARTTVAGEAGLQGKCFADHAAHLVVHGVLHLVGYTHDTDEDAARMEALEVAAMAHLGLPDPYAERTLAET